MMNSRRRHHDRNRSEPQMKFALKDTDGSVTHLGEHPNIKAAQEAALRLLGYELVETEPRPQRVKVVRDEWPENPRLWDNVSRMICFHKRYNLGDGHSYDKDDYSSWDELEEAIREREDVAIILPLYLYDHSGITMNTTGFSCRWDSGQVGFVHMTKQALQAEFGGDKERGYELLRGEVETYDEYLQGDVWGYELQTLVDEDEWETTDSCHGYFGRKHILEEVARFKVPIVEED